MTSGEFQDLFLRWLRARRDYPLLDHGPAPTGPAELANLLYREFYRTF